MTRWTCDGEAHTRSTPSLFFTTTVSQEEDRPLTPPPVVFYLAGIGSSLRPPGADHGRTHPAGVVLVADFVGKDGHVHLLQPVNSRTV